MVFPSLLHSALFFILLGVLHLLSRYQPIRYEPEKGSVWPKPVKQASFNEYYRIYPGVFKFRVLGQTCDMLENAFKRYLEIISKAFVTQTIIGLDTEGRNEYDNVGTLRILNVLLENPCKDTTIPTFGMQEKYYLNIPLNPNSSSVLVADEIWGILRGLETFSQLLHSVKKEVLYINCTTIHDLPRFPHRGLLLDTARHFIPMHKLHKLLDAMSYNKLNVFHWHIVDDESFPYQSMMFPKLSGLGAYTKERVYRPSDVQEIIKYAAERGIRVIVEFDTPDHTESWVKAMPDLLSTCNADRTIRENTGPINPTKQSTYTFLNDLYTEITNVFPDEYLHLGLDEINKACWESDPSIIKFMKANDIPKVDYLETFYIEKLQNITRRLGKKSIVWEEAFTSGAKLLDKTVVQVWRDYEMGGWQDKMSMLTQRGFPVLLSACWYLDHLVTGGDWIKFYACEPLSFRGTAEQDKLVLGGEVCMWTEVVNEYNIEPRIWPRACATAERLWSVKDADTQDGASRRLEEHTCRMNKRGIDAQPPNSAGFCI